MNEWWQEYCLNWLAVLGGFVVAMPLIMPLIGFIRYGMGKHGDDA